VPHFLAIALFVFASTRPAPEPTVRDVNVRGLRTNGTTTIVVTGDDLGKAPKLLLPFAAKQTLKKGSTDKKAEFEVELKDATPGFHHLRVVTEGGVSLPIVIGVDSLPQLPFATKIESLPVALHGSLTGAGTLETSFTGKSGQKIVVEVESQRIGGKLKPVVHLYNARKLQLGWAWSTPALRGDTRLTATLPADGTYTVTLHDAEYAGQNPGIFRLKIGTFDYAEHVFPPVVTKATRSVELIGSTSAKIDLPAKRGEVIPLAWPKGGTWSGPQPFVELSSRQEFVESIASGKPLELPAGRVGVSGKLSTPGEEDKYRVAVEPKSKVRFEVFAERLGSPLDTSLVIRNDAGAVLAQVEDSVGTLDPTLEFTVPDKVTSIIVGVVDSQGRGGPHGIYRLTIDPSTGGGVKGNPRGVPPSETSEGPSEFRLTTPLQRLNLPAGGKAVVPVFVERLGTPRKIVISATGFPANVKLEGTVIPADADGTLVTVTAPGPLMAGFITWTGRTPTDENSVMVMNHPLERLQPWLASEFAIAPTNAKPADFSIDWKTSTADMRLSPGGKLALPVKLTRTNVAAPVRLTLLTSQAPPLVNGRPNAAAAIRIERPTELGAKVNEGAVPVVLPNDLPADAYQVAVLAELLSPDRQRVLATAVTPVRKLFVALPVAIRLDDERFDAILNAKANTTVEVSGSVERMNGASGDVTLTLTGVPPGVPAPGPITVKAGDTDFAFKLTIPPTTPVGETKLKIVAVTAPDAKQPNVRVKSRDVEPVLNVTR
jgi:hypothetical protein